MSNNHGGKRENSGRKPKADELRLIDTIKESITDNDFSEIWKKIASQAKKGSPAHIKILFEYFYGKPKDIVKEEAEKEPLRIEIIRRSRIANDSD